MRLFLPILLAIGAAVAPAGEYRGSVRKLEAVFSIDWHGDGTVSGTYRYPSRPGTTYALRGNNHTEGKLYLEEYTRGALTARCYLSKELSGSAIRWKGEMQNTDGRTFPISFSRTRATASPSRDWKPQIDGTGYRGNIGKLPALFFLHWNDDGSVNGSYYYPSREGVVYRLTGSNPREGKLHLTEHTGTAITAKCTLTKRLTGGKVIWEGTMNNTDGRQFAMAFSRVRSIDTPPTASTTLTNTDKNIRKPSLPDKIVWNMFPKTDIPVEMVPITLEGESFVHAMISGFHSSESSLTLAMELGEIDWESEGPDEFKKTGETVTLQMARHVPIPEKEMVGRQIFLHLDAEGELFSVSLCGIVLTHARQGLGEKLEVRGIVDEEILASEDLAILRDVNAEFVTLVPDKVALELNSPYGYDPYVQTLRLVRDYGIAIQSDAAGPGVLELESISIEPPAESNPWYYIGDTNVPLSVPASQQTNEAG